MSIHEFELSDLTSVFEKMVATNRTTYMSSVGNKFNERFHEYTIEEINQIIESGDLQAQQMLSRNYFIVDGFYKRIILYYATLLKYCGLLIPSPKYGAKLSTPHIQKRYSQALRYIDKIPLKEIFTRISTRALVDGTYFGVISNLDKEEFVLIDLPAQYCKSCYKDIHGNDIIEFNVLYFNNLVDEAYRKYVLSTFPKVIQSYYRRYVNGKVASSWVVIPTDIGVCFPLLDDGRPIFLNVLPATIQYDKAVETERERALEEIRKIIVQKIPHLSSDGTLVFEPQEAEVMHNGVVNMMRGNKNISVLTTYADVDAIVSHTAADGVSNSLEKMLQNIYSNAGASQQIFSPVGTQALGTSITNDMALMMILGNKYSRFFSFIINTLFANSNITFKYSILPISYYNAKDYVTDALKLAATGYSFFLPALAMDLSQHDLLNIKELENDVYKMDKVLKPLSSAYNSSNSTGTGEVGRPKKSVEEKSERTLANEESLDRQGGSE